jgi:hypothetical protein
MPRVIHFQIKVDDPKRAIDFYTSVFRWEIKKWDGPIEYWTIITGKDEPGIDGGMMRRQAKMPPEESALRAFACTIEVDSIDKCINDVKNNGGQIAVPKKAIPGVGWLAYCLDTEGNIFGLMQTNKETK